MDLKAPVSSLGGIYKVYSKRLEKLGIKNLEDFLYHIPTRYENFSVLSDIKDAQLGENLTIQGTVIDIKNEYTRRLKIQKAKIEDKTDKIDVVWFNQPYLLKTIKKGGKISISGKISGQTIKKKIESPHFEIIKYFNEETIHTGRLVPIYPETKGVSSKWLRRQVYKILKECKQNLYEYIPYSIIKRNDLVDFYYAIEQIHFPKSWEQIQIARQRLSFDEFFLLQLKSTFLRRKWENNLKGVPILRKNHEDKIDEFYKNLPFELTNAQKTAVSDIFCDLAKDKPMNRLLEGDVGSGKTVVGALAIYLTYLNGFQSVLMAPTEILAQQHFKTISDLLSPYGVKVSLVTGSKKLKKSIKSIKSTTSINSPASPLGTLGTLTYDVLIGTHALLSNKIKLDKLGLVIIDEQQRFGVEQRAVAREKGKNPHLLSMTATPIPRTIALTLYGDLDLSYLDEMPIGRKKVKTWLVPKEKRSKAYKWIEEEIRKNKSQAFIICPFIEESESMQTVKAAVKEFEVLKKQIFPSLNLGLLHGKLKSKEKDKILTDFKNKKFDILIATPVVEVGIDVPNATVIVIEGSERFGLSQLHQLRGRVGRGNKESYCLLFTNSKSEMSLKRLKGMETIFKGAELAELDLKLRGPGEIYGTTQHGLNKLKIASFSDFKLIQKTKIEAENIFAEIDKHPKLMEKLKTISSKKISKD